MLPFCGDPIIPECSRMKFSDDLRSARDVAVTTDEWKQQAPKADGAFSNSPYWNFNDGELRFNYNTVDNPNPNFGAASALLPE